MSTSTTTGETIYFDETGNRVDENGNKIQHSVPVGFSMRNVNRNIQAKKLNDKIAGFS